MRLSLRSAAAFETINYTYAGGGEAAGTVPELLLPCLITLIWAREEPLRCGGCAKDENGKKNTADSSALFRGNGGIILYPVFRAGGDNWNRTSDPLHVKQVL